MENRIVTNPKMTTQERRGVSRTAGYCVLLFVFAYINAHADGNHQYLRFPWFQDNAPIEFEIVFGAFMLITLFFVVMTMPSRDAELAEEERRSAEKVGLALLVAVAVTISLALTAIAVGRWMH